LFSYTDVAAAAFSSFGCVWVDGKNILYYFPSIDCSSASYTSAYILQIFIVLFYVIGVPLATVLCSWWYYNSVIATIPGLGQTGRAAFCADSLDSATTSSEHFISAQRYFSWWGPLFSYFTKEAFFYQGLVLGRRAVYSMVTIVLEPSINLRAMVYGFSSFVFLAIHTLLAPYRDDMLNKVESISLSLHVFLSILISPWEPPFPLGVQVSLCFFVVVPTVFFVGWRTKSMLLQYLRRSDSGENETTKPTAIFAWELSTDPAKPPAWGSAAVSSNIIRHGDGKAFEADGAELPFSEVEIVAIGERKHPSSISAGKVRSRASTFCTDVPFRHRDQSSINVTAEQLQPNLLPLTQDNPSSARDLNQTTDR
jgi:hypothetical protein